MLPLSLPPSACSEEGDSSHASVTAQLSPESAPFPDTLTYRLSLFTTFQLRRYRNRWTDMHIGNAEFGIGLDVDLHTPHR